jgi:hypothetical protein
VELVLLSARERSDAQIAFRPPQVQDGRQPGNYPQTGLAAINIDRGILGLHQLTPIGIETLDQILTSWQRRLPCAELKRNLGDQRYATALRIG